MKRRRVALPKVLLGFICIAFAVALYKLVFDGFGFGVVNVGSKDLQDVQHTQSDVTKKNTAVLVVACNRPSVKRCLDLLLKARKSSRNFPIIVSIDCGHRETTEVVKSYGRSVILIRQPDLSQIDVPPNMKHLEGYYKVSRHYRWALTQVFDIMQYDTVIIVEDDLEIAPDFFEYFIATLPLLHKDPTLWCISAWNDNGKLGYVRGNELLYRSDFFPGLGWALTKSVWDELRTKWPNAFWDDWMRHPDQRKGRACIRPEIPRTKTFGRIGVSNGQFYDQHLKNIQLNKRFYPFTIKDTSYLMKGNYDKSFKTMVYNARLVSAQDIVQRTVNEGTVRIEYKSNKDFVSIAKTLGIMSDLKAGVPRMGYLGIVSIMYEHYRVFVAPQKDWKGYVKD